MTRTNQINNDSSNEFLLKIRETAIEVAIKEIIGKRINNHGRLPQGAMRQILAGLRASGVETDRDHLNYLVSKQQQKNCTTSNRCQFRIRRS
jgi:hypothetical protein